MLVSVTQFHLKSLWLYPEFSLDTYRVVKQVKRSGGIIRMRIKPFTLRTLTAWNCEEGMRAFRNSGAHLHAMKRSREYGGIKSVSWEADTIPDWPEAIRKLETG